MPVSDQGRVAGTNTESFTLDNEDVAAVKSAAAAHWTSAHPGEPLPDALKKPESGWSPQSFTLHALTVGMFAEMSAFCLAQRGDILGTAADAMSRLPAAQQSAWMEIALSMASRQEATPEELNDFEGTPLGAAFMIWSSLGRDQRLDFPTPQHVKDLLMKLALDGHAKKAKLSEIHYKFLRASGREVIKNSAGQPADL
jgi:hypothetical protein